MRYPWESITTNDLVRVFRSESWAGTLVLSEFQRVLGKLGLNGHAAVGSHLFNAFDQDGSGHLDFREMFIGMSLLLASSREERMECAFAMMDNNGSGRVSRDEVEVFLRTIAPHSVTKYELESLAVQVMRECDTNRSGLVTFREFMVWPGKQAVLDWIDDYYKRVLARFGPASVSGVSSSPPRKSSTRRWGHALSSDPDPDPDSNSDPNLGLKLDLTPDRDAEC